MKEKKRRRNNNNNNNNIVIKNHLNAEKYRFSLCSDVSSLSMLMYVSVNRKEKYKFMRILTNGIFPF